MMKCFKFNLLKYSTIILSIIIVIFISVYFNKPVIVEDDSNYVAYYLDDNIVHTKPLITDDVTFDHATCDNDATITFDVGEWKANIKGINSNTKCKVYFVTNNNAWQLPGGVDLETGMTAIKFVNGKIYKADTNEKWYDYRNHEWANAAILTSSGNAKTTEELDPTTDIYQMYVWIPRYAYKTWDITNGVSNEHIIPIVFQSATTKNNSEGYITHPAFKYGQTELNGFWVGKFETATNTGIWTSNNNDFCTSIGCANAANIIIKPNVISLTNINVANMFNVSRSIESNFGLTSADIDTHMMKNTEWGAVTYLTQSIYGLFNLDGTCANSAQTVSGTCMVFINNINVGYGSGTNSNSLSYAWGPTVTGCSAAGANTSASSTNNQTNPTCATNYVWNNKGVYASTTGNMSGIYDMSGGSYEYVMGNQSSSSLTYVYNADRSGLTTQPDDKYIDHYLASNQTTDEKQRRDSKRGLLGDATYEIIKTSNNDSGGWNSDYTYFVSNLGNWFERGGGTNVGSKAGIFCFTRNAGGKESNRSFRMVLSKE